MCISMQEISFCVQVELALCGFTEFEAMTDPCINIPYQYINIPHQYINIPCAFSLFALTLKVHWRINGDRSEQECTPRTFLWNTGTSTYICFHAGVALYDLYPLKRSTLSKRLCLRGIQGVSDHVWVLQNPGTIYPRTDVWYNYKYLQSLSESRPLWRAPENHFASCRSDGELYSPNWPYKRLGWGVMLYSRHVSCQERLSKSNFQSKRVKAESRTWFYEIWLKTTNQRVTGNKTHLQLDLDTSRCFPCIWVSRYRKEYLRFSFDHQKEIPKKCTVLQIWGLVL